MQNQKSTVKLCTQVHAESSDTNDEKFNQTNLEIHLSDKTLLCFFFQQRPLPLILLLSGWIFHRNTYGCHWSANKLPPYFLLAGKTRHLCPQYKVTPARGRRGRMKGDGCGGGGGGRDDRSRWGGRVNCGRELTHMWQDRAVLLMGREKYNNLKKKGW